MALLIQGEWRAAMFAHAFAPVFLVGLALVVVVSVLPGSLHRESVRRLAVLERRTGFIPFLLIGIVVYWVLRLLGFL